MADRPLSAPLPADLPEDWNPGQIVAPDGVDAGLSEQHGYNYLMGQVNAAQRAVNAINEGFDGISGKRAFRFVIGASAAGWTQADCDYLCNGTNDNEGFRAAIAALKGRGGGIVVLAGTYNLTEGVDFGDAEADVNLVGTPGETILNLSKGINFHHHEPERCQWVVQGLTLRSAEGMVGLSSNMVDIMIRGCQFENVYVQIASDGDICVISNAFVIDADSDLPNAVLFAYGSGNVLVSGNSFTENCPSISGSHMMLNLRNGGIVSDNRISCANPGWRIDLLGAIEITGNTISMPGSTIVAGTGGLISGNRIEGAYLLAENTPPSNAATDDTEWNNRMVSVTGNVLIDSTLLAFGGVAVSGNTINAPADGTAVLVRKNFMSQTLDVGPCIVGNFIVGGSIGIHLTKADTLSPAYESASGAPIACNRIRDCGTPVKIDANWSGCMVTDNLFVGSVVDEGSGNIVRLNSDDPGSGGGGTAGVASFNGRTGIVTPQAEDYTAVMVGARPDTWTPTAGEVGAVPASAVTAMQSLTQAEYDALAVKSATTLYLIEG